MTNWITASALILAATGTARAEGWDVTLGAGAIVAPEYEGSDETDTTAIPYVRLQYGRVWLGPDRLGVDAWQTDRAALAVSLGYGGGRGPEDIDSAALDGFAEIDDAAMLAVDLEYALGSAQLFVGLERYLGESDGTSLTLGVRRETEVTDRLSISASASATLSDGNYMERYFGVTAADAAASRYAQYDAGAGLRRIDLGVGANYRLGDRWMLQAEIGAGKLLGDAADSPIVLDDIQPEAMLAVAFRF